MTSRGWLIFSHIDWLSNKNKTKQLCCKTWECHHVWLCIINFPKKSTNTTQCYMKVKLINTHKINKSSSSSSVKKASSTINFFFQTSRNSLSTKHVLIALFISTNGWRFGWSQNEISVSQVYVLPHAKKPNGLFIFSFTKECEKCHDVRKFVPIFESFLFEWLFCLCVLKSKYRKTKDDLRG